MLTPVLVTVGLAGPSVGKIDPVTGCESVKLKIVGGGASAALACHAAAAQKGLPVDSDCLGTVSERLATSVAKAEAAALKAGATCPTGSDEASIQREIDGLVAHVVGGLRPRMSGSRCAAKKIASVGKHVQRLLGSYGANRLKPDAAKLAEKIAKANALLTSTFVKLDEKGKDCQTVGDEPSVAAAAAILVASRVCDDANRCTTEILSGSVCQHAPVTCPPSYACDFRSGSCQYADCCLLSSGTATCVVEIPPDQIPKSQAFCQGIDASYPGLTLIGFGSQCIGWRAAGAGNCL